MNFIGKRAGTGVDTLFSTKSHEYHVKTVNVAISGAYHENITLHDISLKKISKINLKTLISSPNHMDFIGRRDRSGADIYLDNAPYEYHVKIVKETISSTNYKNITLYNGSMEDNHGFNDF